jgi:hypothetical protein
MHGSALSLLLGGKLDQAGLRSLALATYQHRLEILPEQLPARPAAIAMSDDELIDAAADVEGGDKVGADRRRQLTYLGAWRAAVWAVEATNAKRLCSLVDGALTLDASGDEAQADALWLHVGEVFGVRRGDVPLGLRWFELRDWCAERSRALGILPMHLRSMRRRRGGIPMPAKAERSWTDPEAEREQEALRW